MSPSYVTVYSGELSGVSAKLIRVEVDLRVGIHSFTIVGLADKAVSEAKQRVSAAIKNSGAKPPNSENRNITVNLAPADLHKSGSHYDLAIAIGYLCASGQIEKFDQRKYLFLGELALDGQLRPVRGAASMAIMAEREGFEKIILPKENALEIRGIAQLSTVGCSALGEALLVLSGKPLLQNTQGQDQNIVQRETSDAAVQNAYPDFSIIKGQEYVKRALTIAAAGMHNILLVGPPGAGKSALAHAFPGILPPLENRERKEMVQVWSAAGQTCLRGTNERPFRAPHHSASALSLIGGGAIPRPGEISLAHCGTLFLDELPEFPRAVLDNLREPLESGLICITRVHERITMPARFQLIAAMNPCPCGFFGDEEKECRCTLREVLRYRKRISGPLLDRIDLNVHVNRVSIQSLQDEAVPNQSKTIREKVCTALEFRKNREKIFPPRDVSASLDTGAKRFAAQLERVHLSGRGYTRLIKTARTIADLSQSQTIREDHVAEAFGYKFSEDDRGL
ncbi:MAG: YifB family Mg chelatase-like AAA ATPase [Candidatus Liptonbacteria bacterium]